MPKIVIQGGEKLKKGLRDLMQKVKKPTTSFRKSSIIMERDVLDHFEDERGPFRKWRALSQTTLEMRRKSGSGAKILQDSGIGRASVGSGYSSKGATVGTNLNYMIQHQSGNKRRKPQLPKREWLWTSGKALKRIFNVFFDSFKKI